MPKQRLKNKTTKKKEHTTLWHLLKKWSLTKRTNGAHNTQLSRSSSYLAVSDWATLALFRSILQACTAHRLFWLPIKTAADFKIKNRSRQSFPDLLQFNLPTDPTALTHSLPPWELMEMESLHWQHRLPDFQNTKSFIWPGGRQIQQLNNPGR